MRNNVNTLSQNHRPLCMTIPANIAVSSRLDRTPKKSKISLIDFPQTQCENVIEVKFESNLG
ncbi:hypothetical protein FD08_GL000959 [Lentilactobacillus parakefiri DSM 10551]|nr:hypothetical protein FD08_GL000959 [Lentilactobacillus parakefiri DSM 10551]